jgi:hypothetical protein
MLRKKEYTSMSLLGRRGGATLLKASAFFKHKPKSNALQGMLVLTQCLRPVVD